jgi:CubicO group peptidase (beta-lactamase class C family)
MKRFAVVIALLVPFFVIYDNSRVYSAALFSGERVKYNEIAGKFNSLFVTLSKKRGFSGNVLVSLDGNIIYEKAFGYSDRKKKKPLDMRSVFELASVSKQFTSAGIMMLYDEGRLDYDDPVTKFFPDFPYKGVTIRHLLSHRSGLPDYLKFAPRYHNWKSGYLTNTGLMKIMAEHAPAPEFEPDEKYSYSNTGYAVLASIIEKASGMPYDKFMDAKIFKPLGMTNSYVFNPVTNAPKPNQTKGYNPRGRIIGIGILNGVFGDKGIYSSVEDMFKWDQALYSEKVVKQSLLEQAFLPYSYDERADTDYGFGWRIETLENGDKIVFHTGWWGGYKSLFLRRLSDHSSVVVLSNKLNRGFPNVDYMLQLLNKDI